MTAAQPDVEGFGAYIRRIRRLRGMSQYDAARAAGLSPQTIKNLERDRFVNVGVGTLSALAGLYEIALGPLAERAARKVQVSQGIGNYMDRFRKPMFRHALVVLSRAEHPLSSFEIAAAESTRDITPPRDGRCLPIRELRAAGMIREARPAQPNLPGTWEITPAGREAARLVGADA